MPYLHPEDSGDVPADLDKPATVEGDVILGDDSTGLHFVESSSSDGDDEAETTMAAQALGRRLEGVLRAAKSQHLSCGEVLLPASLLLRAARDVLRMAENEPCGLRGCLLYLQFEGGPGAGSRCIGSVRCDPNTVTTFEVYLTLKRDLSVWHSIVPQFIRNLTKGGTIVLSPAYILEKKKLYRSYQE